MERSERFLLSQIVSQIGSERLHIQNSLHRSLVRRLVSLVILYCDRFAATDSAYGGMSKEKGSYEQAFKMLIRVLKKVPRSPFRYLAGRPVA